jgi:hypothetical protein
MNHLNLQLDEDGAPRCFRFGGRAVHVHGVLDHWPGEDHEYFKVHDDVGTYILRHALDTGDWEVTVYVAHDLPEHLSPFVVGNPVPEG